MKAKVLLFAAMLAGVVGVTAAEAQNRGKAPPYDAWCRDVQAGVGGGTVMICRAYTYEQCMAGRTSHVETCYANPLYDPRNAEWRRRNPNY